MRLVDADALIDTMESHVTTMSVCSTTIEARAKGEMKRTCIADAANAPTIDAIPVEWIKNRLDAMLKGTASAESCFAVQIMLVDWKKEQEAR